MKISNKLFLSMLKERLTKAKEDLDNADSILYYQGITDYDGYHKDIVKYEEINDELKAKYPELHDNLCKSWSLVRNASLLLDELLEGM
jgi:hypothetical protein